MGAQGPAVRDRGARRHPGCRARSSSASGDIEALYEELAESYGVADRVEFVGATDDVASWYRRGRRFLLPTAYETFSLVTYEAAACGLPLLVTKVNGVEDLLRDGENGWFIERDAADIADA